MKKRTKLLVIVGIIAMSLWMVFTTSCLTTDTAYRVGYDVGTWLVE